MSSFVYLVKAGDYYKIGITSNLPQRQRILSTENPFYPFVAGYAKVASKQDALNLESKLHEEFSDKQLNGEWFALTIEEMGRCKALICQASIGHCSKTFKELFLQQSKQKGYRSFVKEILTNLGLKSR